MTAPSIPATTRNPILLWLAALVLFRSLGAPLAFLLPGSDEIPAGAIVVGLVIAVASLVGLAALWRGQRWGAWLLIAVTALDVLSSIPAFFARPSGWVVTAAAVGAITGIAVIALARNRGVWTQLQ
ncbi:MAG: hypothetical protein R3C39_12580 [Dehalococcoidia bacterium]